MVYAYPINIVFSTRKINRARKMTEEAKSIKEYYETHDFSIIKDPATGKLNIRIIEIR